MSCRMKSDRQMLLKRARIPDALPVTNKVSPRLQFASAFWRQPDIGSELSDRPGNWSQVVCRALRFSKHIGVPEVPSTGSPEGRLSQSCREEALRRQALPIKVWLTFRPCRPPRRSPSRCCGARFQRPLGQLRKSAHGRPRRCVMRFHRGKAYHNTESARMATDASTTAPICDSRARPAAT
jgi:hypothetical protein